MGQGPRHRFAIVAHPAGRRDDGRKFITSRRSKRGRTRIARLSVPVAMISPVLNLIWTAAVSLLPTENSRSNILAMDQMVVAVRQARADDAADVARVYIDSWHDTYAGILPHRLLCAMTSRGQTARWRAAIKARGRESVMVAECGSYGIVGMTSFGPSRDGAMGFDGEVYTLYVDPAFYGRGTGRALLRGAFVEFRKRGGTSCLIWAHVNNPARFFYEAMGGRLVAERTAQMMGDAVPEHAFGWKKLALAERSSAR